MEVSLLGASLPYNILRVQTELTGYENENQQISQGHRGSSKKGNS